MDRARQALGGSPIEDLVDEVVVPRVAPTRPQVDGVVDSSVKHAATN